jgi:hypothetical protein
MCVFALVLGVVSCAAAVWRTWTLRRDMSALGSSLATTQKHFGSRYATLSADVEKLKGQSPVALAARVDELTEAVERQRRTHQRFAGRIDQRLGAPALRDNYESPMADDEYAALLQLQRGAPRRGQSLPGLNDEEP